MMNNIIPYLDKVPRHYLSYKLAVEFEDGVAGNN